MFKINMNIKKFFLIFFSLLQKNYFNSINKEKKIFIFHCIILPIPISIFIINLKKLKEILDEKKLRDYFKHLEYINSEQYRCNLFNNYKFNKNKYYNDNNSHGTNLIYSPKMEIHDIQSLFKYSSNLYEDINKEDPLKPGSFLKSIKDHVQEFDFTDKNTITNFCRLNKKILNYLSEGEKRFTENQIELLIKSNPYLYQKSIKTYKDFYKLIKDFIKKDTDNIQVCFNEKEDPKKTNINLIEGEKQLFYSIKSLEKDIKLNKIKFFKKLNKKIKKIFGENIIPFSEKTFFNYNEKTRFIEIATSFKENLTQEEINLLKGEINKINKNLITSLIDKELFSNSNFNIFGDFNNFNENNVIILKSNTTYNISVILDSGLHLKES